tara:strand:+ start:276 stop:677 length:402 start_codon:yes stop_codon:yes gene_type:complete
MAVHSFTGVTGTISASDGSTTVTAYVSGDFTLAQATGKYVVVGSNSAAAHTRGLKSASGSLSKAWGIDDDELMTWFTSNTEFTLTFDADAAGTHTYTLSNCIITDLAIEGLEAGAEGALLINCSFEALSYSRD